MQPEGSYHSLVFRLLPEGGCDLLSLPRPATLIRRILPNLWTCQISNPVLSVDIICTLITAKLSRQFSAHVITVMLIKLLINTAGLELLVADNLHSLFTAKSALSLMLTHSVPHCTTCRSVTYQSLNLLVHTVHCHPQSLKYLCFAIAEHHHRLYIKVIGYVLSSSSNTHHHHQHVLCM